MTNVKETALLSKRLHKEIITPHRLTTAVLIHEFFKLREADEFQQEYAEAERKKFARNYCILVLKVIQSPDMSLEELLQLCADIEHGLNETLLTKFKATIVNINKIGIGFLLDIVESIGRLPTFEENNLKSEAVHIRNSVAGYFLRRLIIHFDKLTFSEVTIILDSFKKYSASYIVAMGENGSAFNLSQIKKDTKEIDNPRDQWSKRQAELFIATQAGLLTNNEENALAPPDLRRQIKSLLKSNPDLSEAHYLNYLNYLRVKEFCGSVDSLHHCFDKNANTDGKAGDDKTKTYRFAALNLAVLHFHFDHKDEAMAALKEAIRMAQEAGDNVCLQHALSWLYCLTQCNRDKLIEHSILKSLEINLSYIMSLGILSFGQYGGVTCGNPKQIFETLTKSDVINYQHGHQDLISHSYGQKSSLWLFYGKMEMSSLWSQLLLNFSSDSTSLSRAHYGEGYCEALCNVANYAYNQGEYGIANVLFDYVKTKFPNEPFSHIWMLCENIFKFTYFLHREKFNDAEIIVQKIATINKWESYLRMAELHVHKSDFSRAHTCVNKILSKCQDGKRRFRMDIQVRAMILLAEVQCASSFPESVPPGLLALLNSSLAYASDYHLEYYMSLVQLHIANVQLLMGMPAQALNLLDRCIVQTLAHGGNYDQARAMLLYVKCLVANSANLNETERKRVISEAAEMLNKVRKQFEKIEAYYRVKDVLYLQANLYDEVGSTGERNRCAMEYRLLSEDHPTTNPYTLLTLL